MKLEPMRKGMEDLRVRGFKIKDFMSLCRILSKSISVLGSIEMKKKLNKNKKNQNKYLVILILLSVIIAMPIVAMFIVENDVPSKASNDGWLSFIGSYLGGLITLITLYITTKDTREIQRKYEDDKLDVVSSSAFIIYNDLKVCFQDIAEIIIIYSIYNSSLNKSKEERAKFILDWKALGRGYTFYNGWRERLEIIFPNIDKKMFLDIYEIYSLLEKSLKYNDFKYFDDVKYNDDFNARQFKRSIEYIPKEHIFNNEFVKRVKNLETLVMNHDESEKDKSTEDKESVDEAYKINTAREFFENLKNILDNDRELLCSKYVDIIDDKWIKILDEMNKIVKQ